MHRRFGLAVAGLALLFAGSADAADTGDKTKPEVTAEVGKGSIEFRAGKALVGRYVFGADVAKPYFWPLHAPGGVRVTRGWPMTPPEKGEQADHPHQKSAWFCHGDVIPEGIVLMDKVRGVEGVDFWSEAKGHGKIVCVDVGKPVRQKAAVSVPTRNEWRTARGVKILDEARKITVHDLGSAWLVVLDIDLHASVCPITFGDTKEGAMGVRVPDTLTEKKGKGRLTNAEGKVGELRVWGRRSAWCDYSGTLHRGIVAGIAIFDDPSNKPACWHSRGYGLMAANPFGRRRSVFPDAPQGELVKLARGEHLKLRYGILLHTGDVKTGKVAENYERFRKLK